jgi:hypothetical protein
LVAKGVFAVEGAQSSLAMASLHCHHFKKNLKMVGGFG